MKLMWNDIIVVLTFILYLGAGVSTKFILASVGKYTEFANLLEANPQARKALDFAYGLFTLQVLNIAFLGGLYFILRRKRKGSDRIILNFYTITLFLVFLQNFLNDFPIALKLMLGD